MAKVNLDAILPREDFEISAISTETSPVLKNMLSISDFTNGIFYPFLRKPDFQRETSEWDTNKICNFIESFINGDLIPGIILWRSASGLYFIIDGAHRISALIAWINDDYGDGELSRKFYSNNIPLDQLNIADKTRKIINKKIGSYQDIIKAPTSENTSAEYVNKAKNLGTFAIQVQWVSGNSKKAEQSFFKINQQGEPLNKTETKLLLFRKKPNCVAARAIIRSGSGHKYWSNFSAENQSLIVSYADEINKILFMPPIKSPIKTLDLPIAGKISSSQTLPLVLDFINIINNVPQDIQNLSDDVEGLDTVSFLRLARKVAWRINSIHPSSLGLHPIVYFYSSDGRHKPSSFYAVLSWIIEMEKNGTFDTFIRVRADFEKLLLKYDYLIQDINRKYRQGINSYPYIKEFFNECIRLLKTKNMDDTILSIVKSKKFNYLKIDSNVEEIVTNTDFNAERKSAVFIKDALDSALKCKICGGFIHTESMTIDHIKRKQDGGLGSVDNGQLTHPYCNTTFKN